MTLFVPQKVEKEVISIRISLDLLKRVTAMALQYSISRNDFINQCIEYALNNMEDSKNLE